jgi:hypothetical protein
MVPKGNSKVLFTKAVKYQEPETTGRRANRSEDLLNATVQNDYGAFESDEKSMDRMGRIIGVAAWKFNQAQAQGVPAAAAYQAIYKEIIVLWKNKDNIFVPLTIEDLCNLQEAALNEVQEIWIKWG